MEERLSVIIDADIKALQSALNKAKTTITQFSQQAEKGSNGMNVGFRKVTGIIEGLTNKAKGLKTALTNATSETRIEALNKELHITNAELARLKTLGVASPIASATRSFNGLTRSVGNTNGVAIEFSRIIQDAPFGIIGISNNIQQLTANFAQLKTSAGSTGAALKASLASLISPANLLVLGVSAITAAFTAYQMGAFDFLKSNEEAANSVKSLNDRLKEFVDTASAATQARIASGKSIEQERIRLDALNSVMTDSNASQENRTKALQELRDKYPSYLKGLTDEELLTNGLVKVYDRLTESITKRATAVALEDKLVELARTRIELNEKLLSDDNNAFTIQKKLFDVRKQYNEELDKFNKSGGETGVARLAELESEVREYEELMSTAQDVFDSTNKGLEENKIAAAELADEFKNVAESLIEGLGGRDKDPVRDKIAEWEKELIALGLKIQTEFEIDFDIRRNEENTNKRISEALTPSKPIDIPIEINFDPEETVLMGGGAISELESLMDNYKSIINSTFDPEVLSYYNLKIQETQEALRMLKDLGTEDMKSFTETLGEGFMSLGNQIAMATGLARTGWEGFARTLLSNAPKLIQAVIAQARANKVAANISNQANLSEATGNAIVSATQSAKKFGPFAAYALPALIAGAVALVSGAFGKGGGGGGGTGVSQAFGGGMAPTAGLSQSYGFTNATGFNPGNMQIELNARIGNDAIYLSNKKEENKRGRI